MPNTVDVEKPLCMARLQKVRAAPQWIASAGVEEMVPNIWQMPNDT